MHFFTPERCAEWCQRMKVPLDVSGQRPDADLPHQFRLRVLFPPKAAQYVWFSRTIEAALRPRSSCLVWVTEWGTLLDRQNQHLYYRWRQSYGDRSMLIDAPGHLCLDYESAEVVTLVHLAMLSAWDAHIIPVGTGARVFISHHEWVEMGFDTQQEFEAANQTFSSAGLDVFTPDQQQGQN